MSSIRELKFVPKGKLWNRVQILDRASKTPLYTCTSAKLSKTITLHEGSSANGRVLGAARIGYAKDIQLALGDPTDLKCSWEIMRNTPRMTHTNNFEVALEDLQTNTKLSLRWKGTSAPRASSLLSQYDTFHLKLVDTTDDSIIARFIHRSTSWLVMDGTLEIYREMGEEMEAAIVVMCAGILKYQTYMWTGNIL